MKIDSLLKDDTLLEIFSAEELKERGLEVKLLDKLKEDKFQADNSNGFICAMVLNFLHREKKHRKKINGAFVNAYLFSEVARINFSTMLEIQNKGVPVVVEKELDGESDLYVPVKNLHLITSNFEDATVESLALEYYQTRSPRVAQELGRQLEQDLKNITFHLCPRLGIEGDWNAFVPEAYYALLYAMDKWRPDRGASFRTYLFDSIRFKLQKARYRENRINRRQFTILDKPTSRDEDATLKHRKADTRFLDPLQNLMDEELAEIIRKDIADAPERARPLLTEYFFGGRTYAELGKEHGGVTREMIRQRLKPVLMHPWYFKRTRKYMGTECTIKLDLVSDLD
ncbi:sigma-70 family RNA polymerase sigma factor [Candidatus Woesearchaeota archaeon]|nr:sigma-70 family RNA polymerase sigma factor [Candidatus Woesearchaeota archaeon]MBW3006408.1 sigma-70 family RNA polymerase sigma factor [Candidatus Woesearchaeota archaeon]